MTQPNHLIPSGPAPVAADFVDHLCGVLAADREQMLTTLGAALLNHRRRVAEPQHETPRP